MSLFGFLLSRTSKVYFRMHFLRSVSHLPHSSSWPIRECELSNSGPRKPEKTLPAGTNLLAVRSELRPFDGALHWLVRLN